MTKLQQIVKRAKEIRKASPKKFPKWTDYIKAASKQLAGFEGVSKQGNKTAVHYTKKVPAAKRKAAPAKKTVQAKLFGVKKSVSAIGANNFGINQLKQISQEIAKREAAIKYMQPITKYPLLERANAKNYIKYNRGIISNLKKQITIVKKSIK